MLEQGQPDFTQELASDDEPEASKTKKSKAHVPLPFARGGESKEASSKPVDEEVPLLERLEHVIDLRSGKSKTQELTPEVSAEPAHLEEVYEAPPMPKAIDESVFENPDLPEGHHYQASEWLNIELDRAGHAVEEPIHAYGQEFHQERRQEKPVELDYEDVGLNNSQSKDEENEVAVASGQLAVSTETDDEGFQQTSGLGSSNYSGSVSAIAERIAEMVQNAGQTFGSFTAFDVVLWAILFLIIIAIIFAIRA